MYSPEYYLITYNFLSYSCCLVSYYDFPDFLARKCGDRRKVWRQRRQNPDKARELVGGQCSLTYVTF